MSISLDEVNRIANLARLSFAEDEKQKLTAELSEILNYVDQLKKLDGKIVPKIYDDEDAVNLMRDDVAQMPESPEEFLQQAPSRDGNFIKVKSVLE